MKLLDVQEIEEEKNKTNEVQLTKIKKFAREELRLIESVNTKREEVAKTKVLLNKELLEYQILCDERKGELQSEIKSLESKRAKLMKPIDDIQNEAYKKLAEVEQKLIDIEKKEKSYEELKIILDKKSSQLSYITENLLNRESSIKEKEVNFDYREKKLIEVEKINKESTEQLGKEWSKFHIEVHTANQDLNRQKKEVELLQEANKNIRMSNDAESNRLTQERRAIHDTYLAIEQAKKHLKNGKRKNIQ